MPIGRLHHVVLDTPDPAGLARFWSALLDQPVTYAAEDWVVLAPDDHTSGMAFQLAPDHVPPVWGTPDAPSSCTTTSWSTTWPPPTPPSRRSAPPGWTHPTGRCGPTRRVTRSA